jgi:hypothetical protein
VRQLPQNRCELAIRTLTCVCGSKAAPAVPVCRRLMPCLTEGIGPTGTAIFARLGGENRTPRPPPRLSSGVPWDRCHSGRRVDPGTERLLSRLKAVAYRLFVTVPSPTRLAL